jgi:hypothetical protein
MKQTKEPYRVWDPYAVYLGGRLQGGSVLMAYDIPQVLGYHGNEIRYYDDLLGGKGRWEALARVNPTLVDLTALRYLIVPEEQPLPGFHKVVGPVAVAMTPMTGKPAVLYEQDSVPAYARVIGAAVKVPEEQIVPTVQDPRFPLHHVVLYPDTVALEPAKLATDSLVTPPVTATVASWAPGRIHLTLAGEAPRETYLMVSENWYPDWHATVDGQPAEVLRANNTFLSVPLPPGAREVRFEFASAAYARGKVITLVAALLMLVWCATGLRRTGRRPAASSQGAAAAGAARS